MKRQILSVLFGAALVAPAACSEGDLAGTPLDGVGFDAGSSGDDASTTGDATCTPEPETPIDPATLPSCCMDGAAHCVPQAHVPGVVQPYLASCTGGYCVPDPYIRTGKVEKPVHCQSLGMADGVCLSVCIPQVATYKTLLPQSTCAPDERCAPCISPLDKKTTGACDIGSGGGGVCKPGEGGAPPSDGGSPAMDCPHTGAPIIDPVAAMLPACYAAGGAHCLDKALVPAAMASRLAMCATGLCVPDDFIKAGGNFIPKTCASVGGDEGRCLHMALPEVAAQASMLKQSSCATYEKCVPCFDPRTSMSTGACGLSCDPGSKSGPPTCPHVGPPYIDPATYPACGSHGGAHCMDTASVPSNLQSQLAHCTGGFCVPDVFIGAAGRFVPPTCNSIGGGEGRCLHETIPQVASQSNLPRSTCAAYEKCVPCTNPIDGTDTGSCHLSCDPGLARPKFVFPGCCNLGGATRGKCVPASMVPSSEASQLGTDTCNSGNLCAPTENLLPTFHPQTCTAFALVYFGNYSGVCLSDCLQFSGIQGLVIKQGDCDGIHQCVPCYTPGGQPSGAPGCN